MADDPRSGKGTVTKTLELPVSAEDVWEVVGDYNGLARWNAGVARSDLTNEGKRRTLTLKVGGSVVEDLVDYDWRGRRYTYSIVESAIPVTRHKATISVIERGPNMSTVHWTCEFQPKGVDVPTVAGIFTGIFEGGLKQLEHMFRK
ncbi:MAG: SRPBCC family protein [Xanthobacteraceae bacterium]